jgi:hypothetical protein
VTAAIDTGLLFELVWAAAAAGVVVAVCVALVILGVARSDDLRREGRHAAATASAALAGGALLGVAALIVFGISVIVAK